MPSRAQPYIVTQSSPAKPSEAWGRRSLQRSVRSNKSNRNVLKFSPIPGSPTQIRKTRSITPRKSASPGLPGATSYKSPQAQPQLQAQPESVRYDYVQEKEGKSATIDDAYSRFRISHPNLDGFYIFAQFYTNDSWYIVVKRDDTLYAQQSPSPVFSRFRIDNKTVTEDELKAMLIINLEFPASGGTSSLSRTYQTRSRTRASARASATASASAHGTRLYDYIIYRKNAAEKSKFVVLEIPTVLSKGLTLRQFVSSAEQYTYKLGVLNDLKGGKKKV